MNVVLEERADGISILTLNRPEKRNAVTTQMALDFQKALQAFTDSDQKVLVITGAGEDAFCAGADLGELPEFWRMAPTVGVQTYKPVVAAVSGWCIGGGFMLAMMCDLIVASEDARFSYPEARVGVTHGAIAGLAARIPLKVAMEIMLLGNVVSAQRAHSIGLVNEVVPRGQPLARALAIAAELKDRAPLVLRMLKRHVLEEIVPKSPMERSARHEMDVQRILGSDDFTEGFAAARQRRRPEFQGR